MVECTYQLYKVLKNILQFSTSSFKYIISVNNFDSGLSYILLPCFFILAVCGINFENYSFFFSFILILPNIFVRIRNLLFFLNTMLNSGQFKIISQALLKITYVLELNYTITISLIIIVSWFTMKYKNLKSICFYGFFLTFYYDSFFNSAYDEIVVNSNSIINITFVAFILCLTLFFEITQKVINALIFSFVGIWGILNIMISRFKLDHLNLDNQILDDIFFENNNLMAVNTTLFLVMVLTGIFLQFTLDILRFTKKKHLFVYYK